MPPQITVVGDLMLDRYWHCDTAEPNPEASGLALRVSREDYRLGGAANVANICAGFGASVTATGVVGDDTLGGQLTQMLSDAGINTNGTVHVDPTRVTTVKTRVVYNDLLRPDRIDHESVEPIRDTITAQLANVRLGECLVIQDYGNGVVTPALLKSLIPIALAKQISILVDPSPKSDWSEYQGVSLIKANRVESLLACPEPNDIHRCVKLSRRFNATVVITLGAGGMVVATNRREIFHVPAHPTRVRDACGAGDTVLAVLAVSLPTGRMLRQMCQQAAIAAAAQISALGVCRIAA